MIVVLDYNFFGNGDNYYDDRFLDAFLITHPTWFSHLAHHSLSWVIIFFPTHKKNKKKQITWNWYVRCVFVGVKIFRTNISFDFYDVSFVRVIYIQPITLLLDLPIWLSLTRFSNNQILNTWLFSSFELLSEIDLLSSHFLCVFFFSVGFHFFRFSICLVLGFSIVIS